MSRELLTLISEISEKAEKFELSLILVGGAVRDFLLTSKYPRDLDFELCPQKSISEKKYRDRQSDFYSYLESRGRRESLSIDVERFYFDNFEIEIALAREEIYSEMDDYSHKDFSYRLILEKDFLRSFKRRDFTINAIGKEFIDQKIIDPFQGKNDLENKILRACDYENFFKDPVRFLRMIRFELDLKFSLDQKLIENLSHFSLKKLTFFYFKKEAFSSKSFFKFFELFFQYIEGHKILISNELIVLKKLFSKNIIPADCLPQNEKEIFMTWAYFNQTTEEMLMNFVTIFSLKKKWAKKMLKIIEELKKNKQLNLSSFEEEKFLLSLLVYRKNLPK